MRGTTLKREGATALGDLPRLASIAERTTIVRAGLALALAAALAGAVLLAISPAGGRAALLPEGAKTGVLVLDMSGSVSGGAFQAMPGILHALAAGNQAMGLVMFSDTAYELLPPNSPVSALFAFERFFKPQADTKDSTISGETPWAQFTAGTNISKGLVIGELALQRAGVKHGAIVLISDLADSSGDQGALLAAATALNKAHIPVRIIAVNAGPTDKGVFAALFGANAFVKPTAYRSTATEKVEPFVAAWPWSLIVVGVVLAALLAANELLNTRLRPEPADMTRLRRAAPLIVAVVLLGFSVMFAILAVDIHAWQERMRRDDATFDTFRNKQGLWRSPAILPGDPAYQLLGIADPRAYRHAVQRFWHSQIAVQRLGNNPWQSHLNAARVVAGNDLLAAAQTGRTSTERSRAANFLGVMTITTPTVNNGSKEEAFARAAAYFQQAILTDPDNYAAKVNLELLLELERPLAKKLGSFANGGFATGGSSGAGKAGGGY